MLKNEVNINNDKITICEFSLIILERSFTGKNPPDEIKVNARFNESKVLIEKIFRIIKIKRVKPEYKRKIFVACFKISELLKDIKFVKVFLKLSS
tara:strand:- start:392 stop:676 length:285 start_codon:yes stop_codon:yes gene_type:complete